MTLAPLLEFKDVGGDKKPKRKPFGKKRLVSIK